MPKEEIKKLFTTGEIAERCEVSVRTVQYYDEKGIVHPTKRSEGGRRLYDEVALEQMQSICLLKALGLSLKAIRGILENPQNHEALLCLLEEQEKALSVEISKSSSILKNLHAAIRGIKENGHLPEDIETSMDPIMETGKTKLYRTKRRMLIEGVVADIICIGTLIYGILVGQWLPLVCSLALIVIICAELVREYYQDARFVCPHCHTVFQPNWTSFFVSAHTPKTRKLTCTNCGEKNWCAEVSVDRLEATDSLTRS